MAQKTKENATAVEKTQEQVQTSNVMARKETPAGISSWYTPLVDVAESDEAFLFQADLPGVKSGDLDVSYDRGTLSIQAKVQPREKNNQVRWLWQEYGIGHYYRSFSLPVEIDVDGIKADLTDGVLTLYVPKADSARKRRIPIQAG
jgi:HSP20 family protein